MSLMRFFIKKYAKIAENKCVFALLICIFIRRVFPAAIGNLLVFSFSTAVFLWLIHAFSYTKTTF